MTFNIGDKIRGTKNSNLKYGITNENSLLEVIEYLGGSLIGVKILDIKGSSRMKEYYIGMTYNVNPIYFYLEEESGATRKTPVERKIEYIYKKQKAKGIHICGV